MSSRRGMPHERDGSIGGFMTEALEMQRQMCDEAMNLVKAGMELQNATPPNAAEAEARLSRAVDIMEQALAIRYGSVEEKDAADRLNNKMLRYVKMIKSQRGKSGAGGALGGAGKRTSLKHNIIEMDRLPEIYTPLVHLFSNSSQLGDIFETLKRTFGFQEANVANQKEHLMLLLTNFKEQGGDDGDAKKKKKKQTAQGAAAEVMEDYLRQRDPQQEMELASRGVQRFHARVFTNYKKWCKYVSQKPKFNADPLVDIVLFFLVWGEAGNFRQMPECLCFLLHTMLPQASSGGAREPGDFLASVIRPMYAELKRDNDKKTLKGARAPHNEIRNYDDFNEFFWNKKCLKYDPYTIGEAFAAADKKGRPKIVKKTFVEHRSWMRAIWSFRRIFFFNCALFMAVLGFSVNMVLFCPDSPIMYGPDIQPLTESKVFTILGKEYAKKLDPETNQLPENDDVLDMTDVEGDKCLLPKLATCLGVDPYKQGDTFSRLPIDFKTLLQIVPFTNCLEKQVGRCRCYHDLIDSCFGQKGTAAEVDANDETVVTSIPYNQETCIPNWRKNAEKILDGADGGFLNCDKCSVDVNSLLERPTRVVDLMTGLIDFGRDDKGVLAMGGGFACLALILLCEIQNRFFSGFGMGFVGRSLPVPMKAWCRYTCFWIGLYIIKLIFDYQFVVKSLVETSLFIWNANEKDYLQYSHFLIQFSFHNIAYLLFLWIPAWMVFLYDAQIFYSILSVVYGSFAGFNLRIGELRSFRILRLTFKSIPGVFNRKIVPNILEELVKAKKKKSKKKKASMEKDDVAMPVRRFERISMSQGAKPLTVKAQKYSSLLEQREDDDVYNELKTPSGADEDVSSQSSRASNLGLREADVISDRELNVLSYLIDSKDTVGRKLYPPAFLTAGKLDESIDIVIECAAVYEKLKTDKKKKDKVLQKIETTMRERLLKDDLRVESILGSYKFSSQVLRILLGEEHRELDECYNFIEEAASHQQILKGLSLSNLYQCRAACAELMKSILEVPKKTTESSIKFQRSLYKVIDSVEAVINCLKKVLSKQENLVQLLNDTPLKPNSFFFPADTQHYASLQLQKIVNDEAALDIVSRAYQLLTVDNFDAEPRSEEGRRRLRFFANSLFMDMPEAKPIRKIRSLTVSTPYYNEIVMYSIKDLTTQNDDSIKLLYYLQTIYPFEWENLMERIQAKDMNEALKKNPEEVQLWASYRGQTLARTVRGMMYNEDAVRFLHWLEIGENEPMHQSNCTCNKCMKLNEMVALKFNYVCTCQIYGKQKDEQRQQAQDIDYLMKKHPNLRVAYVDGPKKMKDGPPKFFSVLIRSLDDKIVEVYRVELPGDPIIGEGKPENQNHAIIFSRGELLQCIDMNQDGYLEDGMDGYFLSHGGLGIGGTLNTSWAFQFGFLLVVPVIAVVGYRATGRGFTIKHEKFAELFRFYAFSHFYRGVELLFLLLLFAWYGTFSWCNCSWRIDADFYNNVEPTDTEWKERCYANQYQQCVLPTNQNYGIMSFSLWIIAATWMWAPFFFNPSGLDWDKIIEDYNDWQNWLRTTNDSAESWFGWWSTELEYLEHTTTGARFVTMVRKSRFLAVAVGMYLQLAYKAYFEKRGLVITSADNVKTYILSGAIIGFFLLMFCCGYIASRVTKKMSMKQRKLRKMKFVIVCFCMLLAFLSLTVLSIVNLFEFIVLVLVAVYWFMQMTILKLQYHHIVVRALARAYDRAVGWIVFGPVMFVAMFLPFIGMFQQRVMFNNAFTSGLEVSKLFSHDVAPTQVVKVKRVAKKKKRDD
ncbi:hypothetical protein PybrP1_003069 [[Pythium] brassicae (nom. inval.)]|nr:hypothetical protein PybrP1_003069 [[Pythium] brassicae (nom. inval.)]